MFLLDTEGVMGNERFEELADIFGEIGVSLACLGGTDGFPGGNHTTTQDASKVVVAVCVMEVEAVIRAGVEILVENSDKTFFVRWVGTTGDIMLSGLVDGGGGGRGGRDLKAVGETDGWVVFEEAVVFAVLDEEWEGGVLTSDELRDGGHGGKRKEGICDLRKKRFPTVRALISV